MVYEVQRFVDLVDGKEAATADHTRTTMTLRVVDEIVASRRYSQACGPRVSRFTSIFKMQSINYMNCTDAGGP